MCINNPQKIVGAAVPKYGYKLMRRNEDGILETPYHDQKLKVGVWQRPNTKKEAREVNPAANVYDNDYLNAGRFSVFKNKADIAVTHEGAEVWKVEIQSRSAFEGSWGGKPVLIVNKVKLLRRVKRYSLFRRFKDWLKYSGW